MGEQGKSCRWIATFDIHI